MALVCVVYTDAWQTGFHLCFYTIIVWVIIWLTPFKPVGTQIQQYGWVKKSNMLLHEQEGKCIFRVYSIETYIYVNFFDVKYDGIVLYGDGKRAWDMPYMYRGGTVQGAINTGCLCIQTKWTTVINICENFK